MGKIFYMMGKSASGKDTIYRRILTECGFLKEVVLYTTRPMRDGETEGKEYHFTTQEGMEAFLEQGKVIEIRTYQTVAGPWSYATVDDGSIDLKKDNYLAIGTLESYEKVLEYYGAECVEPIYITVDDGVRMERALARERQQTNPNYAEMCRRYLADEADFSPENLEKCGIDHSFQNEDLEICVKDIAEKIRETAV
jgi:guanylate kinase